MSLTNENKIIISDTSCLVALERIEQLSLLHDLFGVVFVTEIVAAEFGKQLPDWLIEVQVRNVEKFRELALRLHEGEASSIALALEIGDCQLILDDGAGRRAARQFGLDFIGTIGLGVEAKRRGLIRSVKPFIERLRQVDFRFSEQVERDTLRQAGEL